MLFALTEAISSIRDFMEQGGAVLWLIAISCILYVGNDI